MKEVLLSVILFTIINPGFSQVLMPNLSENPLESGRIFDDWKSNVDLEQAKGWKWYARHKAFTASRMNGKGQFPNTIEYQNELSRIAELKKLNHSNVRSGSSWSPAGPVNRPPGVSSYASHNMGRINCMAFHPTDSNIFYVGVAQGGVWKTENHGQSWRPLTDDLPIIRISDVAVNQNNPDEIYICVGDYAYIGVALETDGRKRNTHYGIGVYRSEDGGENWTATSLGFDQESKDASLMRRVIFDTIPGRAVAAGVSGIWETLDSGQTWNQIRDSLIWDIEQDRSNPGTIYASTGYVANLNLGSAGMIKSTDYGRTWVDLNTGIPARSAQRVEIAISASHPNNVYAITCDLDRGLEGVYRSFDAGQNWIKTADSPNVLEWSDGSGSGGQGTYDLAILVDPNDPERILTGGVNIWGSEDGGISWKAASYWYHRDGWSTHADQHFFDYNPLDQKFYVCNDGGLYRTDSIGLTNWPLTSPWNFRWPTDWENLSNGMQITAFYRLGISEGNPGNVIAGAQDNGTYYKNSGSWRNVYGGDGMDCMIDPVDPNTIYMSSQYGRLVRSYNAGFQSRNISDIPSNEEGEWTTPMHMHPQNPGIIYAGYGNLYQSQSQGSFWNSISNFPNLQGFGAPNLITAFDICEAKPASIYLAKRVYFEYNEPSSVWKRQGTQWVDISNGLPDSLYPTSVEVHELNDDTAWVTFGGFVDSTKVFVTHDGGSSWQNISEGLPNIPVNIIKRQHHSSYNSMYLGTDIGIYFRNDTTPEWQLYSDGLPNVIVSDLEIHYSEEKLYASTFGRGIWFADLMDTTIAPPPDTSQNPNTSSLFQLDQLKRMDIYPNPNKSEFELEIQIPGTHDLMLEIADVQGKVCYSKEVNITDFEKLSLNPKLESGMYYLRLRNGNSMKVKRFIVSK